MSRYTLKDVIVDPNDPRLEGALGKECYVSNFPSIVVSEANSDEYSTILVGISKSRRDAPFNVCNDKRRFECIILKKERKQKYVPFDLSKKEVKDKLRGQWIAKKESLSEFMITGFGYEFEPVIYIQNDTYWSAIRLFEKFTFLDGTPCGELVEEEEA